MLNLTPMQIMNTSNTTSKATMNFSDLFQCSLRGVGSSSSLGGTTD